ncbi:hypothetical protein PAESOLCIP111_01757 [Paenibacillus solanacearum]|uniref:Fibronectin type-III domain-containing protein n=1 Tax=Paenibacillus solanacearum TaxID=2048548 RepID=A0A916JY41_9BACL|nr:hypothetical protein [Paenibacillus solanacearum]CAG7614882.1 hypothetical protein PAESOLCIP111_01757 [Paenibacillus solanacearum]
MIGVRKQTWGYSNTKALMRAVHGEEAACSDLNIVRLAPGDGKLRLDWKYEGAYDAGALAYEIRLTSGEDETELAVVRVADGGNSAELKGLDNGKEYRVSVRAMAEGLAEPVADSPVRQVRTGDVPGTVINYIHPDDYTYGFSGRSPASPSIVKLPGGEWIASHDVYWGKAGQNLTKLFRSADEGRTWSFLCDLYPCFWGKLFLHRGALYMLGTSTEYGALLIGRSDDGGRTWSAPTEIIPEGSREARGPHRAPMPVVEHKGRLWTAVEFGSWQTGGHDTGIVSVPADGDLLDPAQWAVTPFLSYSSVWPGTIEGGKPSLLEGNAVVTPDGGLVNLLRYNTKGGSPEYGRAIMLNVDDERPEAPLSFRKVIDFHGNMSKFTIHYDAVSGKYWSLVNRVTLPNVSQRNILTLVSSEDLEHWHIHKDVLNYQDNGWPEDATKVGFQYVDWQFDGDNIVYASRTAINGAFNYHNANYLTFHTIAHFRN